MHFSLYRQPNLGRGESVLTALQILRKISFVLGSQLFLLTGELFPGYHGFCYGLSRYYDFTKKEVVRPQLNSRPSFSF